MWLYDKTLTDQFNDLIYIVFKGYPKSDGLMVANRQTINPSKNRIALFLLSQSYNFAGFFRFSFANQITCYVI